MREGEESAPALALVSGWASGRADVGERARPEKKYICRVSRHVFKNGCFDGALTVPIFFYF